MEALEFGQQQIQPIIAAQIELAEMVGKRKSHLSGSGQR
jgi:polyribonucleotide nucleotidyltransferase